MKVIFLGAGAWGTAMAMHASKNPKNFDVTLWSRSSSLADEMTKTHRNQKYLPNIDLPLQLKIGADWETIFTHVDEQDLLVLATPVSGLKETVHALLKLTKVPKNWVWLCKGLEPGTSLMPHQVIERELKLANAMDRDISLAVLSGPSFASEVAKGMPCALTAASSSAELVALIQQVFHHGNMRVYGSDDVVGVELGGAIKNVLAIATGIGDGLGLGLNARAAVLTRGLSEMMRLIISMGGKSETAMGLTGVGDLILTATGDLSRNRQVGLQLASGKKLSEVLSALGHVAEGVRCAQAVNDLAKTKGIEMPITHMVCEVLFNEQDVAEAVKLLMSRDARPESR
ncbi:MAG: NAD(P)H-dependent glycerol-3-phosphate dehydrogenase [Polynucleobacter sp.]|jgi:glycerol-3-phosphate dehydrogenase (NAD(P)+)